MALDWVEGENDEENLGAVVLGSDRWSNISIR